MHRIIILSVVLILICIQVQAQNNEAEYSIVRQDERITLFERWANFPGTTIKSRDLKIVFQTSATLENIFLTITNEKKIKEWQKNIIDYKHFAKTDSAWSTYSLYETPWPLTNQDYLLNYFIKEKNGNRIVIYFEHTENDKLMPVRDDTDRMPAIGKWVLERISADSIQVTYMITSKPVSYPRFMTDKIVRNNFMSTLNSLLSVIEKK